MALKKSIDVIDDAVEQLAQFKSGELKPISTGVEHLDEALLGGLLPSTCLGIVGGSGHGKSYLYEKIQRHIQKHHPDVVMAICNWEMEMSKLLVRDLAFKLDLGPKQVLFDPITEKSAKDFKRVCDSHRIENVFYQNEPVTPDVFEQDIDGLIAANPDKRMVVIIDNLENILVEGGSQKAQMDKLLYKINVLKKTHPFIAFIILNQMNRDYNNRLQDIKQHRPLESDIYGSSQLYKLCDVVLIKLLPWKFSLWDKFMFIREGEYDYLDDFKIEPDGLTTSFDPYGNDFYFYVKTRLPADFTQVRDIHIESIFERKDAAKRKIAKLEKHPTDMPVFTETDQQVMAKVRKKLKDDLPF